jgi:hypothetical protein
MSILLRAIYGHAVANGASSGHRLLDALDFRRPRNPKLPGAPARQPSTGSGRSEQILLNYVGCEIRKIPAAGEVFFLDLSLWRTNQEFARLRKP